MKLRMLVPFLPALLAGALNAQSSCPRERTRLVPTSTVYQRFQDCGGISFQTPGLEIDTGAKGCPLLVIYTPEHDEVEPSAADTRVVETAVVTELLLHFACEREWLLFIPIGSKCVHVKTTNGGVMFRRRTDPCEQ